MHCMWNWVEDLQTAAVSDVMHKLFRNRPISVASWRSNASYQSEVWGGRTYVYVAEIVYMS